MELHYLQHPDNGQKILNEQINFYIDQIKSNGFPYVRIFGRDNYYGDCYRDDTINNDGNFRSVKFERALTSHIMRWISFNIKSDVKLNEIPYGSFVIYENNETLSKIYFNQIIINKDTNHPYTFIYSNDDNLLD